MKYGTYLTVFLVPILCFGNRYLSFSTSRTFFFYGAVEILLAVWLYQLFIDASYRLSKKDIWTLAPLLALISWLTLSAILGPDPEMSFWSSLSRGTGLLTWYHVLALVFIITSLTKRFGFTEFGRALLAWFVAGIDALALSVWFGNEGFNLGINLLEKSKGGGFMGNSSLAATAMVFALFCALFLMVAQKTGRNTKIFAGLSALLIIFSPLFIGLFGQPISARGALLGIVAGFVASWVFFLSLAKKKAVKFAGVFLLVLGALASIFVWSRLMSPETKVHARFSELATESRFIFWNSAQSAIKDHPLFGLGPENYRIALQKYFDPHLYVLGDVAETWNDKAHNIIFETGVAGGYPAIVLYFVFLTSLFYSLYRAKIKQKMSRSEAAVLGGLIVAYFVQNLFVFDSVVSLMSLAALSGLIYGLSSSSDSRSDKMNTGEGQRTFLALGLIVAFVFAWIFFTWRPAHKTIVINKVIGLSLDKRPEHYADLLKGSVVGDAYDVGSIADDAYHLYADNEKALKEDVKTLPYALTDLEKLIDYLGAVAESHPYDLRLHTDLAKLYNLYMNLSEKKKDEALVAEAVDIENLIIKASPGDPQGYWVKAITQVQSGDAFGARETAKEAYNLAPFIDFSKDLLDQISG